jgi:hypothetical protein
VQVSAIGAPYVEKSASSGLRSMKTKQPRHGGKPAGMSLRDGFRVVRKLVIRILQDRIQHTCIGDCWNGLLRRGDVKSTIFW